MIKLNYGSSQEAWEGINEYFLLKEDRIIKRGGNVSGAQVIAYDMFITIRKAWVDPEFDFTHAFNYRQQKWTTLVNNYIDRNTLDILKSEVLMKEKKNTRNYNLSLLFTNSHSSGKGCLLNITFARRAGTIHPILIVTVRSSEVVKRLLFDFLLIQRIGEYVYGEGADMGIQIYIPNAYTSAETSTMYHKIKPLPDLMPKKGLRPFQQKVLDKLEYFKTVDPEKINYKIHLRAVKTLQMEQSSSTPKLLAKNLLFT